MTNKDQKILLVDDEEKFLNSIAERLKLLGFDPLKASSGRQALELAKKQPHRYGNRRFKNARYGRTGDHHQVKGNLL